MNFKKNDMEYIPCEVNRFIEYYDLVKSKPSETIEVFFMTIIILFPNKPKRLKFIYHKSSNYINKFKSCSLRLDEYFKTLGIYQYEPLLKKIQNNDYVFLVNPSNKKPIFKKGQKIRLAQMYIDNAYKYKKIKVDSSSSFTFKDSSEN